MSLDISILLIAAVALVGWWLALRPSASYRGVAPPISYMIVAAAVLMCLLAISDQQSPDNDNLPYHAAVTMPGP